MLDHDSVLGQLAGTTRAAESGVVAHHGLELERDVLRDVRRVSAFAKTMHEAAAPADAAPVLDQSRQRGERAVPRIHGASADEWSSNAPIVTSMRVTGLRDQ